VCSGFWVFLEFWVCCVDRQGNVLNLGRREMAVGFLKVSYTKMSLK